MLQIKGKPLSKSSSYDRNRKQLFFLIKASGNSKNTLKVEAFSQHNNQAIDVANNEIDLVLKKLIGRKLERFTDIENYEKVSLHVI